jgi:ferrochelatase
MPLSSEYAAEPTLGHGTPACTAVVLVNLGTPDAPTASALRRYLREFLSDPRVVEIPRIVWWPILHGVILNTRPAKSAAKYASVWTDEGSPLAVWTAKQATLLQGYLGERGLRPPQLLVRHAMRYGDPSIASVLDELKKHNATRVLIFPLYPQYAAATTASANDAVMAWAMRQRRQPELRFVQCYHDDALYIRALVQRVRAHWQVHGRGDKLVLSFHGLPERSLRLGDPYHCECHKTARLLAEGLGLNKDEWLVTFQSRFGKAKWLEPYTEPTLVALARQGVTRVDVFCPGFAADCLETLEEIAQEARAAFLGAGGRGFEYIPALNDQHEWIAALSGIAMQHLQGWEVVPLEESVLAERRARALAMGAKA